MTQQPLATLRAEGKSAGGLKSQIQVRDLAPFIVDEPERLGGTNEGPNPLEYLLGAVSACTSIIINYAAKEQNFKYNGARFSAEGTLDPRGFKGVEGVTTYFQTVKISITLATEESNEKMLKLKETVEQRCPIYNLLKDAGVDVTTDWHKE
ncbi:OsmC family protein [Virgibacillus oceani]